MPRYAVAVTLDDGISIVTYLCIVDNTTNKYDAEMFAIGCASTEYPEHKYHDSISIQIDNENT